MAKSAPQSSVSPRDHTVNVLRAILKRIPFARMISEEEIRRDHLLQLQLWRDSAESRQRPALAPFRRKWRRFNLAVELHLASAVSPASWPESNLPVAHSSLTLAEGFRKAKAIFKDSIYSIYCVGGNTTRIEPLLGCDSIVVFEKIGPGTISRQPLQRGDIVISHSDGVRSLQRITRLDENRQEFTAHQVYQGAISSIERRLVAVFYTGLPAPTEWTCDHTNQPTLLTRSWDDVVFRPSRGDKPTPHSGVALWGTELDRARRVFPSSTYTIWTTVPNTNSMEPLLDTNTAVIFETLTEQALRHQPLQLGDIVTWHTPAVRGALHRIVGRSEDGTSFYIKGDNCWWGDSLESRSLIPQRFITRRVVALIYGRQMHEDD
ncbi:hypothetical protein TFLX_06240 [Thermoflexales bacterium]|nr:hypothetical protein TFLX_06240 [Thermoflexales bacterium]